MFFMPQLKAQAFVSLLKPTFVTMLQERVINSSKAVKISGGDDVTYLAPNIVTRTFFKKSQPNVCKPKCFCYANISSNSLVTFSFYKKFGRRVVSYRKI
jgi:hypothetical protein